MRAIPSHPVAVLLLAAIAPLSIRPCHTAFGSSLPDIPQRGDLLLLSYGPTSTLVMQWQWAGLRKLTSSAIARHVELGLPLPYESRDILLADMVEVEALLASHAALPIGARIPIPTEPTLVLVLDPGTGEAQFHMVPEAGPDACAMDFVRAEKPWPSEMGRDRSVFPPQWIRYYLATAGTRGRRHGERGSGGVDFDGRAWFSAGACAQSDDPAAIAAASANLAVAMDDEGRWWLFWCA